MQLDAAHAGSVTAIAALDGRVWSSGGRSKAARLREWSMSGALHADVDLSCTGARYVRRSQTNSIDFMIGRPQQVHS